MPRPAARRGRPKRANNTTATAKPGVVTPTKQNTSRNNEIYEDDSDGLVAAAPEQKRGRGRPRKEVYMSGGLGRDEDEDEDEGGAKRTRNKRVSRGMDREEPSSAIRTTSTAKTRRNTPSLGRSSSVGRRGDGSATPSTAQRRDTSSNFSVLRRKGDASSRVQKNGTPAFESSMLSAFRPRQRQMSILHMMEDSLLSDADTDDEDLLGSILPEDESTPLHVSNRMGLPDGVLANLSPSASRIQLPGSIKRKKLDDDGEDDNNNNREEDPAPQSPDEPMNEPSNDDHEIASEDDLLPPPLPKPHESPEIGSQTMIPPVSSSDGPSPTMDGLDPTAEDDTITVHKRRSAKRSQRKKSTIDPATKASVPTDILRQNLLPRRRRRQRRQRHQPENMEFDIEDSDDTSSPSDVEEDAKRRFMPRRPGRPSNMLTNSRSRVNKKGGQDARRKGSGHKNDAPRKRGRPKSTSSGSTRTTTTTTKLSPPGKDSVTYSSRPRESDLDKENQPYDLQMSDGSPDTSATAFVSDELLAQARKFAEIGQWELEFEDVSPQQSSPGR
ncbi:hypothetical protein AJ80_04607 [Polytolypa hystricis UAMH7299]|uniref:Uncharacterized protein n=1 Tax=Polytolypa hystricis (strain UAMH7299) TaxID=1447883 RepID=A0A2B7Y900_POLH7|nr:hypothetical protein AJ80_04607 [Polytolypa hystricis UAMH7299]